METTLNGILLALLAASTFVWGGFGIVLLRDREFFLSVPVLTIAGCLLVLFVALLSEGIV